MKILVINPPFVKNFCRTQRWAARTRGRVLRAPDWLAYATAILEEAGHDVALYDFPARKWNKVKLAKLVAKLEPDFVILDSTTPSIYSDIECARIVKENSMAKVIMVGPHASALPKETLAIAHGLVDVIAVGEYDQTVKEIIKNYDKLETVKGIVFWCGEKIVKTQQRPLIEELDELPFPAWHHLKIKNYFDGLKLFPHINIISGRGCPNKCCFCIWPQVMHGHKYRLRSVANVVDEIEHDLALIPELKHGEFFFEDDTFTVFKDRAIAICEEILRRRLNITFSVNARVDTADLDLFRIMKKAGCRELVVGFESSSQLVLDAAKKNIKREEFSVFIDRAHKAGLKVHGCFVLGLPGETIESARETVELSNSLGCDSIQLSGAVPFPGTEFFEIAKLNRWIQSETWTDWLDDGEQQSVVNCLAISQKEISDLIDEGLQRFYLNPHYILKFFLEIRSVSDLYRKIRGGINFLMYRLGF